MAYLPGQFLDSVGPAGTLPRFRVLCLYARASLPFLWGE